MSLVLIVVALILGAFVHRPMLGRLGGGTAQHLLRLPGNLVHELAHAVMMLLTGYTVSDLKVSLFDPAGRGHVASGPPWTRFARPWLTNLVSPVAPAFVGLGVLAGLHVWSGAPALPTSLEALGPVAGLIPWTRWQLWVALPLAFSVAAEMSPSDVDFRIWRAPASVAGVLIAGAVWALQRLAPGLVQGELLALDAVMVATAARALTMAMASAVLVWPVAWALTRLRTRERAPA